MNARTRRAPADRSTARILHTAENHATHLVMRYRPAARQGQAVDSSTCHMGFRCILRDAEGARMNEKPAGNAAQRGR